MKPVSLKQLEKQVAQLSLDEQLELIEWLVQRLRKRKKAVLSAWDRDLAAMAADPEIQKEFRKIEREFAVTEGDGLEKL